MGVDGGGADATMEERERERTTENGAQTKGKNEHHGICLGQDALDLALISLKRVPYCATRIVDCRLRIPQNFTVAPIAH